jgi:hypothetical protein
VVKGDGRCWSSSARAAVRSFPRVAAHRGPSGCFDFSCESIHIHVAFRQYVAERQMALANGNWSLILINMANDNWSYYAVALREAASSVNKLNKIVAS